MTNEEYHSAAMDVVYLASCAVKEQAPEEKRVAGMDLKLLYRTADRHLLTAITAMALESAGVKDEAFTQAKGKAIRKVAAMEVERAAILKGMEEAGIWYAPLKGCVMKDYYPQLGMRQMSDNDILCDATRMSDVQSIMEALGYEAKIIPKAAHDAYYKEPVFNFEMHRSLFDKNFSETLYSYYSDVKERLLPDGDKSFGRHFSDEDFYVYMTAHEYKHYSGGGTGLRSLLDTYVYLEKRGGTLDWTYIAGELKKLGIEDFEKSSRELSLRLFGGEALTEADCEMLDYVVSSGTYGTWANAAKNQIAEKGRIGYLLSRTFLPYGKMTRLYPVLEKLPFLLPFCWVLRWIQALFVKPQKVLFQLKTGLFAGKN